MHWSVLSIEYPPETYTVKYGTDRSNLDMKRNGGSYWEHKDDHQVQLSALQWNTTYYCSVMVRNGCGKEVETDPVTFNTLGLYSESQKVFYAENLVRNIHVSTVLVHECAAPQGTDIWDVMTCCVLLCNLTHAAIAMLCAY